MVVSRVGARLPRPSGAGRGDPAPTTSCLHHDRPFCFEPAYTARDRTAVATLRTREATQERGVDEAAVEEELNEVTARALTLLREQQPQLFDARGRLRRG